MLTLPNGEIMYYQLIRNILTGYKYDYDLTVIIDSSRIDLIREIMNIVKSLKSNDLKKRIDFITWQEIIDSCGQT